jgi:hypothetical protein
LFREGQNIPEHTPGSGYFSGLKNPGRKSPPHHFLRKKTFHPIIFLRQKNFPPHHSSSAIKVIGPSSYKAKTRHPIILRGKKLTAHHFKRQKNHRPIILRAKKLTAPSISGVKCLPHHAAARSISR